MSGAPPRAYDVDDDVKLPYEQRIGHLFDVFLNGDRITRVIRFDADAGWVERFQTDANNSILFDRSANEAKREILRGHIETRWRGSVNA